MQMKMKYNMEQLSIPCESIVYLVWGGSVSQDYSCGGRSTGSRSAAPPVISYTRPSPHHNHNQKVVIWISLGSLVHACMCTSSSEHPVASCTVAAQISGIQKYR